MARVERTVPPKDELEAAWDEVHAANESPLEGVAAHVVRPTNPAPSLARRAAMRCAYPVDRGVAEWMRELVTNGIA